jgi:hypothetical protein
VTRVAARPVRLPGVDQPRMVRVTLEFEQGSDPPCGRLLDGQAVYPFAGWLGLAAALEHVIGAGPLTRPGPRPSADELGSRNTTVAPWREKLRPGGTLVLRMFAGRREGRRPVGPPAGGAGPEVAWSS